MKNMWYFLLFLFPFFARSEESLAALDQLAQAFFEAHDYTAASSQYERLLSPSLPRWQQTRLFYNLGTIRLAQHQPYEALTLFQKVTPTDLSLPRFGRDLFLNQGIAGLQYAQTLPLDLQALFIEQSLNAFQQAQVLDCQVQKSEKITSCSSHLLIDQWIQFAHLQQREIYQKKRQQWMEQASRETLASFIQIQLKQGIKLLQQFQDSYFSKDFTYFQHHMESFFPIWVILQEKEFTQSQKSTFDQAVTFYLNALQALTNHDLSTAVKELNQSIATLDSLAFQKDVDLQQAHLSYQILLLQEWMSVSQLKELLSQLESLEVEKEQSSSLDQIKKNLQTAIQEIPSQQMLQARFFLLSGVYSLEQLIEKNFNSTQLLQQAIEQAQRALQLLLLASFMKDSSPHIQSILNEQQQVVISDAESFIAAVLHEQQNKFQQTKNASCQQFPWEQVIPLFDRGWQHAQAAKQQLQLKEFHPPPIAAEQKQTIKDWQNALNLLLHPPSTSSVTREVPQNLTETLRLIQEMYLQDQSPPEQPTQELHTW